MKTRSCHVCKYRNKYVIGKICTLGHTPRFYLPRNGNPHDDNSGYKKKCNDYKDDILMNNCRNCRHRTDTGGCRLSEPCFTTTDTPQSRWEACDIRAEEVVNQYLEEKK